MAARQREATGLAALSADITALSEKAGGLVVSLNTRGGYPTSGTIWETGHVVTADHVLHREEGIIVTLADGSKRDAEVAGRDASTDLALLRVETGNPPRPEMTEVDTLKPGSLALSLSRNTESTLNASLAVINAIGGEWQTPLGGTIDHYLRLDVAVHPGFSGGPLVDSQGRLIGVDSSRLSRRSAVAIPAATVSRVVEELKEKGYVRRGYLGIASFPIVVDAAVRSRLGLATNGGLIVVQTEGGTTSQRAGMLQGDILVSLDGNAVSDPEELQKLLGPESVGRKVKAQVVRGGSLVELDVEVGERPQRHVTGERWARRAMHRRYRGG